MRQVTDTHTHTHTHVIILLQLSHYTITADNEEMIIFGWSSPGYYFLFFRFPFCNIYIRFISGLLSVLVVGITMSTGLQHL